MKVLLINGSPHANGSTYTALHEMEKVFEENEIETQLIHIGKDAVRGVLPAVPAAKPENVLLTTR